MSTGRLDSFISRHRKFILIGWIIVFVAALPFFIRQYDHLTDGGWEAPDSGSLAVQRSIQANFERGQNGTLTAVLSAEPAATPAAREIAVERLQRAVAETPSISLPATRAALTKRQLRNRDVVVVPLVARAGDSETIDRAVDLRDALQVGANVDGVRTYLNGRASVWAGLHDMSRDNIADAERIGVPIVILILLLVFGSLAAASLQIALAAASVVITGALIFFISQLTDMSVFSISIASLVGIGVAVDYALFILARYREERHRGSPSDEARRTALATSGKSVLFSGTVVTVSLASLWLTDSTLFRSIAIGAVIVVAVSVLAALILLPAMIAMLGERLTKTGPLRGAAITIWERLNRSRRDHEPFWNRWVDRVVKRPAAVVIVVSAIMITLATPALFVKVGDPALTQFPVDHELRRGAQLAASQDGAGSAGPVQIVATFERGDAAGPANRASLQAFAADLRGDRQVASISPPQFNASQALLTVTPRSAPESTAQIDLLHRIERKQLPDSTLAKRAIVDVGGATAAYVDVIDLVSDSVWRIAAFVLIFSFLTMIVLLRSIVLPLKAILMNMLSIGAAYGVLVIVFQWNWFGFLGVDPLGAVNIIAIPVVFAIAFGLSMDYEVFLLSRIRERYEATGNNRLAVAEGLSASARTITSAALIMVCVFAAFAVTSVPAIQQIGLGSAVAIALDATLVRLALVPAIMELMGRANWWLPASMQRWRVLPGGASSASARTSP